MKTETIKKVIKKYEQKLLQVDVWANRRREKYTKKLTSYKEQLQNEKK